MATATQTKHGRGNPPTRKLGEKKGQYHKHETAAIRCDEVYVLSEFMERAGMSRHAFKQAKKAGLKVKTHGRRKYVTGEAWIAYLNGLPPDSPHSSAIN